MSKDAPAYAKYQRIHFSSRFLIHHVLDTAEAVMALLSEYPNSIKLILLEHAKELVELAIAFEEDSSGSTTNDNVIMFPGS